MDAGDLCVIDGILERRVPRHRQRRKRIVVVLTRIDINPQRRLGTLANQVSLGGSRMPFVVSSPMVARLTGRMIPLALSNTSDTRVLRSILNFVCQTSENGQLLRKRTDEDAKKRGNGHWIKAIPLERNNWHGKSKDMLRLQKVTTRRPIGL